VHVARRPSPLAKPRCAPPLVHRQVAARVLDTELTRDGVKDVLLRKAQTRLNKRGRQGALPVSCSRAVDARALNRLGLLSEAQRQRPSA
jgi:hypothetical protein